MKKGQAGYTMIEVIGVIALLAIIGGSVVKVLNSAFARYHLTRLSQQVVEMQRAVDKRFVARRLYTGLDLALLNTENLLPADMPYKNGKLYHRLSGEVTLATSSDETNYTITFKSLPREACVELAMQNWALDPRVSLNMMKIGANKKLKWKCETGEQNCYRMPLMVADANAVCAASNDISWTFY